MQKLKQSFSEKVLKRKNEAKDKRIRFWSRNFFYFVISIASILTTINIHNMDKKVKAPDWAAFTFLSNSYDEFQIAGKNGIPTKLIIDNEFWSLIQVDRFTEKPKEGYYAAETYCQNKTIAYLADQDKHELAASLMNEIMHAGACNHAGVKYWNSSAEEKHEGIYHMGEFLSVFMHDNPDFIIWEIKQ